MSKPTTQRDAAGKPSPRAIKVRRKILDASARSFADAGFRRVRMEEIAIAAGVSRALLYNYFSSKEELLIQLQQHLLDEWEAAIDAAARLEDPDEAITTWIRGNLTDERRRIALSAICAEDAPRVLVGWESVAERAKRSWHERLAELLQRGVDSGTFRRDLDVQTTAQLFQVTQAGVLLQLLLGRLVHETPTEQLIEGAISMMVGSLYERKGS